MLCCVERFEAAALRRGALPVRRPSLASTAPPAQSTPAAQASLLQGAVGPQRLCGGPKPYTILLAGKSEGKSLFRCLSLARP